MDKGAQGEALLVELPAQLLELADQASVVGPSLLLAGEGVQLLQSLGEVAA